MYKPIYKFPNYKVNEYGDIRNIKKNKLMSVYTKDNGYKFVKLSNNGTSKECRVHRLVAEAFIPNPDNLPFINHKDEDRGNNNVDNLEWCTSSYNNTYGTRTDKQSKAMMKEVCQYDINMNLIEVYSSINEAGEVCGIKPCNISNCIAGRSKTSGGFVWRLNH